MNVPSHRHWVLPVDAGLMGISYLILLILFSRQTEHSRTPSGISRVSLWLFLIQATMDSVSFAGHITFAILAEGRPSLSLIVPAFLACLVFVYEAVRKFSFFCCQWLTQVNIQQFSVLIHQIQGPENYTPPPVPPTQPATATASDIQPSLLPISYPPPPATPTQTTTTTQSAATNNPSPTFFTFFIQHIRTDPQARLCASETVNVKCY